MKPFSMKGSKTKAMLILAVLFLLWPGSSRGEESFEIRWRQLAEAQRARAGGLQAAREIFQELDSKIREGSLFSLWKGLDSSDPEERLISAWSIIRTYCPGGDISQWESPGGLVLPQMIPKPLMIIDGFYTALMGLYRRPNGLWAASQLLEAFVHSTRGRHYFLRTSPEPIASLVPEIAAQTGLVGIWNPEAVVGRMPLARRISGVITDSRAVSEGLQFLNGHGIPQNNGFYAWDRRSGRIYRVVSSRDRVRFRPD